MRKESVTLTTSMQLSENGEHRYLMSKQWDKSKKKVTVIMIAPSSADGITMDLTTLYTMNNIFRLKEYGTLHVVNIFSKISAQLKNNKTFEGLSDTDNDKTIQQSVKEADSVVICWGKCGENNQKILKRQKEVYKLLEEYKNKLFEIKSDHDEIGFHPLAPQIRFEWILIPFVIPTFEEKTETDTKKNKGKNKTIPTPTLEPTETNSNAVNKKSDNSGEEGSEQPNPEEQNASTN